MNEYMAKIPANNSIENTNPNGDALMIDKRYFMLPYLGEVSPKTNRALMHLIKIYCTDLVDAIFVFDTFTFKIQNWLIFFIQRSNSHLSNRT